MAIQVIDKNDNSTKNRGEKSYKAVLFRVNHGLGPIFNERKENNSMI